MENASKALIIAGGILIGILILTLIITLFASSRDLSSRYDETKNAEAIQQFNVNFTKYLGQDLTIHQVVTIYNFAKENGVAVPDDYTEIDIDNNYTESGIKTYKLIIDENDYSEAGYIISISFTENR